MRAIYISSSALAAIILSAAPVFAAGEGAASGPSTATLLGFGFLGGAFGLALAIYRRRL